MKKIVFAASILSMSLGLWSCGGAHGDDPGHAYMPDMYYSRAYEALGYNMVNGEYDSLRKRGISYTAMTVAGTVARGEELPTHLTGDSAGLKIANALKNPLDSLTNMPSQMKEAERLYLVNCGICHGSALDGNGPLYKGGDGPYPAAPRPLNGEYAKALSDGSIFYTITYGKNAMGSYASQLRPEQRWMVVSYIRSKQGGAASTSDTTGKATQNAPAGGATAPSGGKTQP